MPARCYSRRWVPKAVVGVAHRPQLEHLLPGAVKSGAGELTNASAAGYTMLLYALKPFDGRASTTGEAAVFARLAGLVSIEQPCVAMAERAYVAPASISNGKSSLCCHCIDSKTCREAAKVYSAGLQLTYTRVGK